MSRPRLSRAAATATISALLTSTLFAIPASAAPPPELKSDLTVRESPEDASTDQFIVKFKETASTSSASRGKAFGLAAKDLGVGVKELHMLGTGANVVKTDKQLDAAEAKEFISELEANPAVEYAEEDTIVSSLAAAPNDPFYDWLWGLHQTPYGLDVQPAWDTSTGADVVVAVVDSGIVGHEDLDANILPGYDMISFTELSRDGDGRDSNPLDQGTYGDGVNCDANSTSSWHGAHVAGTIAATTNNGAGVAGVAPSAKVIPIRALGTCGMGYSSDIIDSITWASGGTVSGVPANANPARVINLSLGGKNTCSSGYQNAINAAVSRGSVVIAAAGNSADDTAFYSPASCNNVITVGATGPTGDASNYSNWGTPVDVSAPGGDGQYGAEGVILSTVNTGTQGPIDGDSAYGFMQGTSMATPHVAGLAALMISANPSLTPAKVEELLKGTTEPAGYCYYPCGTGIVNAPAAVAAAVSGEIPPPAQHVTPGDVYMNGELSVGSTLSAGTAFWEPEPVTVTYEWFVGGITTPVTTGNTYTLRPEDLGKLVAVIATGTKDGYEPASSEIVSPGPVAPGTLTAGTPTISGTGTVGETLTASDGIWSPAPVTRTRQWLRNGSAIPGATGTSYTLVAADAGTKISVRVTGTKAGYTAVTRTSAETATIQSNSFTVSAPAISGFPHVGGTLTIGSASWSPAPESLTYRWLRNGQAIAGATAKTYTLVVADAGAAIRGEVTGHRSGYESKTTSTPTIDFIDDGYFTAATPTISGEATVGSALKAIPGTWSPAPVFSFQWFRNGVAIQGATGSSYTLVNQDAATKITVQVTGSATGYKPSTKTSSATAPVLEAATPVPNDFSGDGFTDVLARDTAGKLWMYAGNGKGGWLGRTSVGSGWQSYTILTPGDFNGDGNADVLARDKYGALWLYPGNGTGGFKPRVKIGNGWQIFTDLTTPGDFTGDGNADVMGRDKYGVLWLYPGNGKGGFNSRVKLGSGWNIMTSISGPGDFNGDGNTDVLARDKYGKFWLYKGNGNGGWLGRSYIGAGWQIFSAIVTPGDFTGDGNADVMGRDRYGVLWLYSGNGTGGFKPRVKLGSGWNIMNSIS